MIQQFNLSNRPRLSIGNSQLNEVAGLLSSSAEDRRSYVANPTSYLNSKGINVKEGTFMVQGVNLTSEVCTEVAVCVLAIALGVGIFTLVGFVARYATAAADYVFVVSAARVVPALPQKKLAIACLDESAGFNSFVC